MDTQTKQRLTGAAILVVLAVLLIPELLTGRGAERGTQPSPPPAAESMPGADADSEMRSVDLDLRPGSTRPAQAAPQAEVPVAPSASGTTRSDPRTASAGSQASRTPVAADAGRSDRADATANSVVSSPSAKSSTDLPPAAMQRGFAVQLGSFASREAADRLEAEVSRAGFAAFVAPVDAAGRRMFRVRVGPVPDRAAAEALAARLSAQGRKGAVVTQP